MDYLQTVIEKISSAPDSCGVYLMRDSRGKVLYIGKAKSLKKRLLNYLHRDLSNKTAALISKVADIEFKLTANEELALLLEFGLIHKFRPRYNILLKDDKSFPFIKVSREKFPLICITRNKKDKAAQYFGPYTDTKLLKNALKIIRQNFAFRSCRRLPKQSCIYYRIRLCLGPCIGKINSKQYGQIIKQIILILNGEQDLLIQELAKLMHNCSKAMDFEAAASLRDQITVLAETFTKSGSANRKQELEDLKIRLNLKSLPLRIEGFDISNISGKQAAGSMVSFYNGAADKNNYRRFRIKSFSGIDDYKMLAEVIRRRYSRLLKEKKSLPQLLLIDGGKGHLLTAYRELEKLNLKIPIASIAKPRTNPCGILRSRENENIYSSKDFSLLNFPKDSLAMNLIRRIRDEAHRFALSYHRLLRWKDLLK